MLGRVRPIRILNGPTGPHEAALARRTVASLLRSSTDPEGPCCTIESMSEAQRLKRRIALMKRCESVKTFVQLQAHQEELMRERETAVQTIRACNSVDLAVQGLQRVLEETSPIDPVHALTSQLLPLLCLRFERLKAEKEEAKALVANKQKEHRDMAIAETLSWIPRKCRAQAAEVFEETVNEFEEVLKGFASVVRHESVPDFCLQMLKEATLRGDAYPAPYVRSAIENATPSIRPDDDRAIKARQEIVRIYVNGRRRLYELGGLPPHLVTQPAWAP